MNKEQPSGWATFAAVMMFGLGGIALVAAIWDFTTTSLVSDYSMLGDTLDWLWYGFFDGVIAIAAFYAGYDILKGGSLGYVLGMTFATLNSIKWFLFIPGAPIAALTMSIVWILVIYGLAVGKE
ncbi:hypothetical protein ACFLV7_01955 [Chloroflexota bacterium]